MKRVNDMIFVGNESSRVAQTAVVIELEKAKLKCYLKDAMLMPIVLMDLFLLAVTPSRIGDRYISDGLNQKRQVAWRQRPNNLTRCKAYRPTTPSLPENEDLICMRCGAVAI